MNEPVRVLSIDLGASGGRGIVFEYDGTALRMIHEKRFFNGIVQMNGTAYWDLLFLFRSIKEVIREAAQGYGIRSIGIDTWGLDFGLIGRDGALMENPVAYRDSRTAGVPEKVFQEISAEALYAATGTQFLEGNTIYQLMSLKLRRPWVLEQADRMLLMPDLLRYLLTGDDHTEYTIASTTGLMDIRTGDWNRPLIQKLGLPQRLFTQILQPGTAAFPLSEAVCRELKVEPIPVVVTASHDTASAVLSVPDPEGDSLYSSSGTWSILGTELDAPILAPESFRENFANEGGYGGRIRFLRSLMGFWLIQECVRIWREEGQEVEYAQLNALAEASDYPGVIDVQAPILASPGNMPERICRLCTGTAPQSIGDFARCVYRSMALNVRRGLKGIERLTGRRYDKLFILGGGAQAEFLNRCIADATGLTVETGMAEATAFGNAFVQLHWAGAIESLQAYRALLRKAETPGGRFVPRNQKEWEALLQTIGW